MIEYLTLICFVEAAFLFAIGIRVMAARRPLLFNARWLLMFLAVALSPGVVIPLTLNSKSENPIMLINILIVIVVMIIMAVAIRGYIAMGITNESFRAALHNALQGLDIAYEETLGHIKLTSHDLEMQVAVQSWVGTAQVKMKQSSGKPILEKIVKAVSEYYQTHETKTNNITPIFYLIMGLLMLVMGIVVIRL